MKRKLNKVNLTWMVHNFIAHPVSEALWIYAFFLEAAGMDKLADRAENLGNWIHDSTVPKHKPNSGRG